LDGDHLQKTLQKFDIILSPNRPNILGSGSFDGFPLGACVEGSLAGCVIIATDELEQNYFYKDQEEIIIIKPILEQIINILQKLIENPEKLKSIGIAGSIRTKQLYSFKNQIEPRIALLEKSIEEYKD
jgi:Ethanolamine utilization protein EutJ (predicted chaperonin)